jgi:DNA-binding transcriptional LysR family regulator
MNYTLNQLRIFLKVVKLRSITKAAEALHLTQPAVSIQVKNFQDQFEIPLIEVLNKKIYVTDFGQEVAASAEQILQEVEGIQSKLHAFKGELSGKLKISVVSTGKYIAPYFISDFIQTNRNVTLLMDVTNKSQVVESLEKNQVDFALVSVLPDKLNIEKEELMQNKLFLVGNDTSKSPKSKQAKKVFQDLPIIYREKGSATRFVMEKYFKELNLPAKMTMELTSNEAVKQALIAGLGYSIMPLIGLKNELEQKQVQIIPIHGLPLISTWHLIWLKDKKLDIVARAFLRHIQSNKQDIIAEKFAWYEKY